MPKVSQVGSNATYRAVARPAACCEREENCQPQLPKRKRELSFELYLSLTSASPCPVEKYCSKVKVTAEDGEYCPRIEGNIAPELEEYCPANILKAGIVY